MIGAAALSMALAGWPAPTAVFANSYGNAGLPWGITQTIDLSGKAPPNAIAVGLSGMLIISHGNQQETCDLTVNFRPDSSKAWGGYRGQTIEAHVGGGQRSNHSLVVPLTNRSFQVWLGGAQGKPAWPQGCAYGVNYVVDYWIVSE